MPEPDEGSAEEQGGARPFWSGTITFGLVSVPVDLLPANRPRRVSLRMLAPDGAPLRREYWSPRAKDSVETGDTIHAYELEDGRFVEVTDEELEELAPRKTREIDLRLFVDRDALDPVFFERAYFLAPSRGATKPYRLLAAAMESSGKAGIATFVMREREYLIAIIAENGLLRAETMRFADEIRSPEDAGLPKPTKVEKKTLRRFVRALEDRYAEELDPDELEDRRSRGIEKLVRSKLAAGNAVVTRSTGREPTGDAAGAQGDRAVIDLMEELRRRMKSGGGGDPKPAAAKRGDRIPADLESRSKQELYALARDLEIEGRSRMTKSDLLRAIRRSA